MTTPVKNLMAALIPVSEPEKAEKAIPTKDQSPVGGDRVFYTYCVPGAVFEAKDGTIWDLEDVTEFGTVRVRNKWYPREERTMPIADLRKVIRAWIEPVQVSIPDAE